MRHLNTTLTTYLIPYVSNKVSLIFSTERRPGISYCRLLLHDSKTTASEHEPPKLPIVTAVWKEKLLNTFCFIAEVTVNSVTTLLIKYYRSAQIPRSPEISRLPWIYYFLHSVTLLVGWQEGHPACKKLEWWGAGMVICLEWGADLHMAQLIPLQLTVSCFSKIQISFTFLVPAYHWRRQRGGRGPRPPNGRTKIFFVKIEGLSSSMWSVLKSSDISTRLRLTRLTFDFQHHLLLLLLTSATRLQLLV